MESTFNYDLAFSRNIGWFTSDEQKILKNKRIAIAGMGGVGGNHLLTLIRLGITKFNISDFDEFGCENTNRQVGARLSSYGEKKLDVMAKMARDINPEIDIKLFPNGIDETNAGEFLHDVDCYVDSLDFFAVSARMLVFKLCAANAIPATTAAPIGMGTAYLNFLPGKMTFEQYFQLEGYDTNEQYLRFFLGLTPAALQRHYLVEPGHLDLVNKKGPSTVMGCQLAAGVAASQVTKILLNRGDIVCAPSSLHFDAYTNQFKKVWRPWGNNNWLQQLGLYIGRKKFINNLPSIKKQSPIGLTNIEKVLDYARWAPSGDNAQSWKFELINDLECILHCTDTRADCVYDNDGHSSHLAHGILLETLSIAASYLGFSVESDIDTAEKTHVKISIKLASEPKIQSSLLAPFIKTRTVQRRAMGTRPLTRLEKKELEDSMPAGFSIKWIESLDQKVLMAKLNYCNAKTRLTMQEAYHTHRKIIDWRQTYSPDKVPEKSLGVDWLTARLMQWMFKSWRRIEFFNKYLGGTILPRLQLDFLPSLRCSTHFVITSDEEIKDAEGYINAGRATQRFWLTSAKLGLGFQPEQTPLIFARYLTKGIKFTNDRHVIENAKKGKLLLDRLVSDINPLFMGRLGRSPLPQSRSLRKPLSELVINPHRDGLN